MKNKTEKTDLCQAPFEPKVHELAAQYMAWGVKNELRSSYQKVLEFALIQLPQEKWLVAQDWERQPEIKKDLESRIEILEKFIAWCDEHGVKTSPPWPFWFDKQNTEKPSKIACSFCRKELKIVAEVEKSPAESMIGCKTCSKCYSVRKSFMGYVWKLV